MSSRREEKDEKILGLYSGLRTLLGDVNRLVFICASFGGLKYYHQDVGDKEEEGEQ